MDLRQLKYFSSVYELNNLSHAASSNNVAQSAISHHVSRLEEELDVALFIRKPRGMKPTAAGIRLYTHAKKILRAVRDAEHDMLRETENVAGEIAIGLPYSVMKGIGLELMEAVIREYPEVKLTIIESFSGTNFSSLVSAEVDLALFYNPQPDRKVSMEIVLQEEVLCVGKPEVIGNSSEPITFAQLSKLPILLLRQGGSSRALIDRPALLSKLIENAPLQLNSISGINNGLLAGLGCTIAPRIFVAEQLINNELHCRPVVKPELSRKLYIGHRSDYPSNPLFETISARIIDLIRENVLSGAWDADFQYDQS